MTMGLVGRKCGMTRVFTEDGESIPVTVIEAQPNRITQVKTVETDGYRASSAWTTPTKVSSKRAVSSRLICSPKARRLMSLVHRSVKALPVVSNAITSQCRTRRTATRWRIEPQALSVRTRRRVVFSKARKWLVTWVTFVVPHRIWLLCE